MVTQLEIDKGATFQKALEWQDSNSVAIDLTGYTSAMHIRAGYGTTLIHELTTENGGITLGGALGTIDLLITDTDTKTFDPGHYIYDLEVKSAAGIITRILEGGIEIKDNVTSPGL
jgi:hypothetical protein